MTAEQQKWSIGIYQGNTPFSLNATQTCPVIQARDIKDLSADFIADPFMLFVENKWYLFFETLPNKDKSNPSPNGVIGMAESGNGYDWRYQGTVLSEPWHLSYPHVFEWQGDHYMMPETLGANTIRLYKADQFPSKWSPVCDLLEGQHADPSIFHYQGRWWMFSCPTPDQHDALELHHADNLTGPWVAHPSNPIIQHNDQCARPAGRVLQWQNKLYRFAQDCQPRYGTQVRMFEIINLTTSTYEEQEHQESPILSPSGKGWNGRNMHHIDLHQLDNGKWLACVDGYHLEP